MRAVHPGCQHGRVGPPASLSSGVGRFVMRVSFDIDDTLVCHSPEALVEIGYLPVRVYRWFGEPLRRGTCSLVSELRRRGCSIWVYTTSGRSRFQVRRWLLLYGIRVDGVVNDDLHRLEMSGLGFSHPPSKYPPAFGIDLHVDDSAGVQMEGEQARFSSCCCSSG